MPIYPSALLLALGLSAAVPAASAQQPDPVELRVMLSPGFAAAYDALVPEFERARGVRIVTVRGGSTGDGPGAIPGRVGRGEPADVVIVAVPGIEEMLASGGNVPSSRVDLASTGVGMAVPAGRERPDISTPDALRRALLAAASVAYSRGPSGTHVSGTVLPRLGIAGEVAARAVITNDVPATLAAGGAELGFQQMSELIPAAGIDVVGPLPESLQLRTYYAAVVVSRSGHPDLAADLIAFLAADDADPVVARMGLRRIE